MGDLFPYQVEGAAFLAARPRALLADEMGLGKSAQAIAACDAIGARSVLVVCPASVQENWRREFDRFSEGWASVKVTRETLPQIRDAFFRSGLLDDHVGDNAVEKNKDVQSAVQAPGPLRLDRLDGAPSQTFVAAVVDSSSVGTEEVDDLSIGAGESDCPRSILFMTVGVDADPTLPVDNAGHVGENGLRRREEEVGWALSAKGQSAAKQLFVAPTEGGFANRKVRDNRAKAFAGPQPAQSGAHHVFSQSAVGGHRILLVVSYDQATRLSSSLRLLHFDVVIADEAHFLKSRTAKRTQAILGPKCDGIGGLVERAKHVFALTGTPTPNNPSELWPLLRGLAPEIINTPGGRPIAYWSFVQRYCRTRDNGFGVQIVGGRNLDELRERIAPFVLRRKKEQVLKDLPPIRFHELFLEGDLKLPKEALDLAAEVAAVLDEQGVEGLAKIAKHVAVLRRLTGLAKVAPAVEWIRDQVESGLGKLVCLVHHREVGHGIMGGLEHAGIGYVVLDGSTDSRLRQERVDAFQNRPEIKVFIGQLQAAGTGITLTAASDALFVESSWVPAENEQAAMRIHRIGQRNACLVRFATLANSIDEKIQRAVMRKTADIVQLFG